MTTTIVGPTGAAALRPLLRRLTGDEKHAPSAHSTLDVLWVLYDRVLRVDPTTAQEPDRDRFLLSKGHGPAAYYAVLAAKGFFPPDWLDDLASWDSPLGHHPDRIRVPGVEIGTGSLGHGLGLAVGTALGLRAQDLHEQARVFVLLGDAELDEGSNHEAIAYAGAVGLNGLTAIVVDNRSATHGWPAQWPTTDVTGPSVAGPTATGPSVALPAAAGSRVAESSRGIANRFAVNGWASTIADGRDHDALADALLRRHPHRPTVVVASVERRAG